MLIGNPHVHHRSIGSTNDEARKLAAAGVISGTVVTSDAQTSGRGRQGRPWSTPGGALAYSLVLRRRIEMPGTLPLQAGVAVCEAVETLGVEMAQVKWPNDVWIDGRKVAGILVEARPQDGWAVVGIGLNLTVAQSDFPPDLRDRATSVGNASSAEAISALNHSLGHWLDEPIEFALSEFSRRDALLGRTVKWQGGHGQAHGIDGNGNLIVEAPDGSLTPLNAGEVHLDVPTA